MKKIYKVRDLSENIDELAMCILDDFNYGDIITYDYIRDIIGEELMDNRMLYIISHVKNILIEHGIVLNAIIGVGYKILMPNEIANHVMQKNVKKSLKCLEMGQRILHYTPTQLLNKEEKAQVKELSSLISDLRQNNEDKILQTSFALNVARAQELES